MYKVEYVGYRLYRYVINGNSRYATYGGLPDWAKVIRSMDRREEQSERRLRRIRQQLIGGGGLRGGWIPRYGKPDNGLTHSQRVCLAFIESLQPGADCAGTSSKRVGRVAVNCWDWDDWDRHAAESCP